MKPKTSLTVGSSSVSRREFIGAAGLLSLSVVAGGSAPAPEINLLAMGDWGAPPRASKPEDTPRKKALQELVASAMTDYATKAAAAGTPIDAVLPLGDNFYADIKADGLKDENDPRFTERFEKLYPASALNVPFYFVIGNHDYEDGNGHEWDYQIQYSKRPKGGDVTGRWTFPAESDEATWYRKDFSLGSQILTMLALNTNTDHVSAQHWKDQIEWLKAQLEDSKNHRWRIVVAHHPMFTDGYHANGKGDPGLYPIIRKDILSLLDNVAFYVSGHDHNQQHIHHPDYPKIDFLISGAGGGDFVQVREEFHSPYQTTFYQELGFLHLRFTEQDALAKFIGVKKDGQWEELGKVPHT
jgi:hypothetical protein